jgi:hypothetical protein
MKSDLENRSFRNFKDVISTAKREGNLSPEVKLILRGRIDYAVERAEISPNDAETLMEEIGHGFHRSTVDASVIAAAGAL